MKRLSKKFFTQDVLICGPQLLGKKIIRQLASGERREGIITEVEVYRGEEDLACHASKGRTKRTEVMYGQGGYVYVYFIYGMYWLLNVVTGEHSEPQAILIRSLDCVRGPGRVGRFLELSADFYGEDLLTSDRLWIEDQPEMDLVNIKKGPRIGVDYAKAWAKKPWRFYL